MVGAVKKMEESVNPREFEALKALPASDKRVLDLPEVGECVFPVAAGVDEQLVRRLEEGYYDQALNEALDAHGGVFGVVKKEALANEVLYPSYDEDGELFKFEYPSGFVGANRREELRDNPIFDTYLRDSGAYGGWRGDQYERADFDAREVRAETLWALKRTLRSAVDIDIERSPEVVAEDLLGLYESVAQRANSATADELADYVEQIGGDDIGWFRTEWAEFVDKGWDEPEWSDGNARRLDMYPADVRDYMTLAVLAKMDDAAEAVQLGEKLAAPPKTQPISVGPGDLILEEVLEPWERVPVVSPDDEVSKPTTEFSAMQGRLAEVKSAVSSEVWSYQVSERPEIESLRKAVGTVRNARSRGTDAESIEQRVGAWLDKRIAQAEKEAALKAAPKKAEPVKVASVEAAPTKTAPKKPKLDREAYARQLFGDVIDAAEAESESGYSL